MNVFGFMFLFCTFLLLHLPDRYSMIFKVIICKTRTGVQIIANPELVRFHCMYCHVVWSDSRRGFELNIGFIDFFSTRLGTTSNYSAIANLHTLQITTAPAKPFPACCVFTSHSLVTDSNSGHSSRAHALSERRLPSSCLFSWQTPVQNWLGCPICLPYNPFARTK
jgi:hypothetical protein